MAQHHDAVIAAVAAVKHLTVRVTPIPDHRARYAHLSQSYDTAPVSLDQIPGVCADGDPG